MTSQRLSNPFEDFKDPELGQVLLLSPEMGFEGFEQVMLGLGFDRDVIDAPISDPLAGAPAVASFSLSGQLPNIIYSCDPVTRLQVLDVGTAAPALRYKLAHALPLVTRDQVANWVQAPDPREALLGFWGAIETERVDLIQSVAARQEDQSELVRVEAARAERKLGKIDQARIKVIGAMGLVCETALEVTSALTNSERLNAILAKPSDMSDLFDRDVAPACAERLAAHLAGFGQVTLLAAMDHDNITAAPAGLLRSHSPLSRGFPLGYRDFAGWLRPEVIWICWRGDDPQHGRMSFDGLAFTGDRWVYLPRMHRLLISALPDRVLDMLAPEG